MTVGKIENCLKRGFFKQCLKVSAALQDRPRADLRFQRFQIDMLESFL